VVCEKVLHGEAVGIHLARRRTGEVSYGGVFFSASIGYNLKRKQYF
jgi:hypothetical protein